MPNSNKLTIILIVSLTINIALTSILLSTHVKIQQLNMMVEELSEELWKNNNALTSLTSELNYTKQQLEYYKKQLEYYTTIMSSGSLGESLIGESKINIVAVKTIQQDYFTTTYEGVVMTAEIELTPGDGKILVNTIPNIGIDLQTSVRTAVKVAENYTGIKLGGTNVIISIIANESIQVVDGPSAGAAITIAVITAITKQHINNTTYITGTINLDGSIGPVGGVLEKAIAAAKNGCKTFLVPKDQSNIQILTSIEREIAKGIKIITYTYKKVNLEEYLKNLGYNIKVIEVANIYEVTKYMIIS